MLETIWDFLCCRDEIIPCVSAWAGIAGLIVALWTLCKVQNVRDTLDLHKRKRVFSIRLPEHYEELLLLSSTISEAAYGKKNADVSIIVESVAALEKMCDNIVILDTDCSISPDKLKCLETLSRVFLSEISNDPKTIKDELKKLCPATHTLKEEVRAFLENMKAEVTDGFR